MDKHTLESSTRASSTEKEYTLQWMVCQGAVFGTKENANNGCRMSLLATRGKQIFELT